MSEGAHADTSEHTTVHKDSEMKRTGKGKKHDNLARQAQLNPGYHKHDFKQKLGEAFKQGQAFSHESKALLLSEPYAVCTLPNFVKDERFLEGLKDELLDQIFYEKNNDLYKFQQSEDLKKISTPHVKALRRLLYKDFLDWMKDVTGIPFNEKVAMTCSKYEYTDTLLCHDDELEGRRIAFILYLVPPWKPQDGGMLDLFDMDEHGQPRNIVESIPPQWNQLVWFEVTPASFHQVAEVITEDKTRLSIGGWFHGPPVPRPPPHIEIPRPLTSHKYIEEEMVYEWINPIYLDLEVQSQIQEKFEADSEIELQGFLKEEKYQEVVKGLLEAPIEWQRRGPANKRNYEFASEESIPEVVRQCMAFFQSEALFLTLSNLTGLKLHALAPDNDSDDNDCDSDAGSYVAEKSDDEVINNSSGSETAEKIKPKKKRRKLNSDGSLKGQGTAGSSTEVEVVSDVRVSVPKECNPRCRGEVRRWKHGSYTLVHDTDAEGSDYALDAMLFCCCKGWQTEYGGNTSYIAKGEDEELLTVNPAENSLALVYRDKDTLRFVKHVNHRIRDLTNGPEFYDISLCYFE